MISASILGDVLFGIVMGLFAGAFTFVGIAWRAPGALLRFLVPKGAGLGVLVLVFGGLSWYEQPASGDFERASLIPAMLLVAAAAFAAVQRRSRTTAPARAKQPLGWNAVPWADYLFTGLMAMIFTWVVVGGSVGLGQSEFGRWVAERPFLSVDHLVWWGVPWAFFFVLSWLTAGSALRAIGGALQEDWTFLENSGRRRLGLLGLGALPILLCLIPPIGLVATPGLTYSYVFVSGVLPAVALRLANLGTAWWLTRSEPRENDAAFLTWGMLKTLPRLLVATRPRVASLSS